MYARKVQRVDPESVNVHVREAALRCPAKRQALT